MRRFVCVLVLAVAAMWPAFSQDLPPAFKQEVQNCKLDLAKANRITDAMAELTAYTLKQPGWQQKLVARMKLPMDQQIKEMAADPGTAAILKKAALDPKEYTVGLFALRGAVTAAKGQNVGMAPLASPANISLVKANPALAAKFEKAESGMR